MARRGSNRDRIARMREEAAAAERERAERAKQRALDPTTPRRSTKPAPTGRLKIVWVVKDPDGNVVKSYPYPQKEAAEAEGRRLSEQHNRYYAVRKEKVPMDS